MYYTGIDLHKKTSFLTTIDEGGTIIYRENLKNNEGLILEYFTQLKQETKIVIESTASWYWLYDLLSGNEFDVVISNPLKTKAIAAAKIKNDKVDSHMLAQLLRANLIATVYVSSIETRKLKELMKHRTRLVRDSTRNKNRIHMLLAKNNIQPPARDLFSKKGIKFMMEAPLPEYHREQLDTYFLIYNQLKEQVDLLTKKIHDIADTNSMAQLLMTIPGIGYITSMYIVAEIEDISRFPSYRNLASYAGLVPSLHASGGKEKRGKITKQGSPYLRTALIEAAQVIPRIKKSKLNVFYRKRIVRAGYQKAIVATAHKILQYAYYVLKNQMPYSEEYSACA